MQVNDQDVKILDVDFFVTLHDQVLVVNEKCLEKCREEIENCEATHVALVCVVGQPKSGKTVTTNLAKVYLESENGDALDNSYWMRAAMSSGIPRAPTAALPDSATKNIGVLMATKPHVGTIKGRRTAVFFMDIWANKATAAEYTILVDLCFMVCSTVIFTELPMSLENTMWSPISSRIVHCMDRHSLKRLHVLVQHKPVKGHHKAKFKEVDEAEYMFDSIGLMNWESLKFLSKFFQEVKFFFLPLPVSDDEEWNFNLNQKTKYFEALKRFFRWVFSTQCLSSYFPQRPASSFKVFMATKVESLNSLTNLAYIATAAKGSHENIKEILGDALVGASEDPETFKLTERYQFMAAAALSLYQPLWTELETSWRQEVYIEPHILEDEYRNFVESIQEDARLKYGEQVAKVLKYVAPTLFKVNFEAFAEENQLNYEMLQRYDSIIDEKLRVVEEAFREHFDDSLLQDFEGKLPDLYGLSRNEISDEYHGDLVKTTIEDSPWQRYIADRYEEHLKAIKWAVHQVQEYEELMEQELRRLILEPDLKVQVSEPKVPDDAQVCNVTSVKELLQECLYELYGAMVHKHTEFVEEITRDIQDHEREVRKRLSEDVKVAPNDMSVLEDSDEVAKKVVLEAGTSTLNVDAEEADGQGSTEEAPQGEEGPSDGPSEGLSEGGLEEPSQGPPPTAPPPPEFEQGPIESSEALEKSEAPAIALVQREGHSLGIHIGASGVRVGLYGSTSKALERFFSEPPFIQFPSDLEVSTEDLTKLTEDRNVKAIHVHDCLVNMNGPPETAPSTDIQHKLSWEEMMGLYFIHLKEKAELEWQVSPVSSCVVAMDAYTPMYAKFRLKIALALAGFTEMFLVQTTTAIMATYSFGGKLSNETSAYVLITYQSKETFDITLSHILSGKMTVVATSGLPLIKQQDTVWEKILGSRDHFNKMVSLVSKVLNQLLVEAGITKDQVNKIILVTERECFDENWSALEILKVWAEGTEIMCREPKDGILPGLIYFSANPPFTSTPLSESYDQLFTMTISAAANGKKMTLARRNEAMPVGGIQYDLPAKAWKGSSKLVLTEQVGTTSVVVAEFDVSKLDMDKSCFRVTVDRDGVVAVALVRPMAKGLGNVSTPVAADALYFMPQDVYDEVRKRLGPKESFEENVKESSLLMEAEVDHKEVLIQSVSREERTVMAD